MELYKKYRPKKLKKVIGQPQAVSVLTKYFKKTNLPHVLLFHGPTGCGKTTLAKICATQLGVVKDSVDLVTMNSSTFRGLDMVRDIQSRINLFGFDGGNKVWILDEAHQLTGPAQEGLLKVLEDTPDHVWFFICTTDPQKLRPAVRNRATHIELRRLKDSEIEGLVNYVLKREKEEITEEAKELLVEKAEGSARKALVLLDAVIGVEDEDDALICINSTNLEAAEHIELVRTLFNPRVKWGDFKTKFKNVQEGDIEKIRCIVLGYASGVLIGGGKLAPRANLVIQCFSDPFFDSKKAGLISAFYDVVVQKN